MPVSIGFVEETVGKSDPWPNVVTPDGPGMMIA